MDADNVVPEVLQFSRPANHPQILSLPFAWIKGPATDPSLVWRFVSRVLPKDSISSTGIRTRCLPIVSRAPYH